MLRFFRYGVSHFSSGTAVSRFSGTAVSRVFQYGRVTFSGTAVYLDVCTQYDRCSDLKNRISEFLFLEFQSNVSLLATYYQIYMQRCASPVSGSELKTDADYRAIC